jgi:hypothetical protein
MLFQGGYLGTYETKHMLLKRRAQKRLAPRGGGLKRGLKEAARGDGLKRGKRIEVTGLKGA